MTMSLTRNELSLTAMQINETDDTIETLQYAHSE